MNRSRRSPQGNTLLLAIMTIAICSLVIGAYYRTLIPKYRSSYQGASWREALQAAEAGVNHAIQQLNQYSLTSRTSAGYDWSGSGWSPLDLLYILNGERLLNDTLLPVVGGVNNAAVTRLSVDVYTRYPVPPYHPWFRIRSTGRADVSGRYVTADRRDGQLRRIKLAATSAGKSVPYVTRTVEVIVKPKFRFSRAITTVSSLVLGSSSGWTVDSFDSSNPDKSDLGSSAGGVYPSNAAERGSQGNIANANKPSDGDYGPLIDGNGATVNGDVQTAGGDNPSTPVHENVTGSSGMDPDRIRDDFDENIPPAVKPSWSSSNSAPPGNTNFTTGTEAAPRRYTVNGPLGSFAVLPALPGTTGYVEIYVTGDLNLGSGDGAAIVIPPNVIATIYVNGNIDMGNGEVNTNTLSSKVASHLSIFGLSKSNNARYTASGNATQALTFYGPNYAVTLSGTVSTTGAIVSKSFSVDGGGNGGFHYDEALGNTGEITSWVVVSYFEDTRGQ